MEFNDEISNGMFVLMLLKNKLFVWENKKFGIIKMLLLYTWTQRFIGSTSMHKR